jgi:hypothetical protein
MTIRQKGDGKIGCIFWVALLLIFALVAWQVVPVKINVADLDEFITRQAETAGRASAERIKKAILTRANDLGLPVTKDNLKVEKGGDRIVISCNYEIPVSVFGFIYKWRVSHEIDRPVFVI